MDAYFDIYQGCADANRPPISYKVREYFIEFVTEKVLKEKKIIIYGKWNAVLGAHFPGEGPRFTTRNIFFAKGGPRTVKDGMIKLYEILIPLKVIQEANEPYLKTIELMYEAIKIFLTSTYKKITPEFMEELWKEVDLEYLFSLPYPAPLIEQKYIGDTLKPNGEIAILQFSPI